MDATYEAIKLLGGPSTLRGSAEKMLSRMVVEGLPRSAAESISKRLYGRDFLVETDLLATRLSRADSERTARLAYILALAHEVFGSWKYAVRFLKRKHLELEGATPLEACATEWGWRSVECILRSIQFGLPV